MHKQRLTNFKVKKKTGLERAKWYYTYSFKVKKILKHELHLTNTSTSNGLW